MIDLVRLLTVTVLHKSCEICFCIYFTNQPFRLFCNLPLRSEYPEKGGAPWRAELSCGGLMT